MRGLMTAFKTVSKCQFPTITPITILPRQYVSTMPHFFTFHFLMYCVMASVVHPGKIRSWIESGELEAINLATNRAIAAALAKLEGYAARIEYFNGDLSERVGLSSLSGRWKLQAQVQIPRNDIVRPGI
jgi:hypothetical protein